METIINEEIVKNKTNVLTISITGPLPPQERGGVVAEPGKNGEVTWLRAGQDTVE